jgi:hypothetical protein
MSRWFQMTIAKRIAAVVLTGGLILAAGFSVLRLTHPAKARAQNGCNASTIQGTFVYAFEGLAGGVPVAGIGRVTLDGSANGTGSDTISINGVPLQRTYTGTYTVNSDCTGSATYKDSLGQTFHESGIVMNGGNQIAVIVTDPGAVLAFTDTRQ